MGRDSHKHCAIEQQKYFVLNGEFQTKLDKEV